MTGAVLLGAAAGLAGALMLFSFLMVFGTGISVGDKNPWPLSKTISAIGWLLLSGVFGGMSIILFVAAIRSVFV